MTALLSRPLVQLWIRSVTYSVSKLRAGPSPPTPRSCEKHSHHEWEDTGQPGITWGHQEEDCIHELSKRLSLCVFMGPSREIPTAGIGSKVMLPRPTESTVKTERLVASVGQAPTGECLAAAWGGPQNEWVCVCVCVLRTSASGPVYCLAHLIACLCRSRPRENSHHLLAHPLKISIFDEKK